MSSLGDYFYLNLNGMKKWFSLQDWVNLTHVSLWSLYWSYEKAADYGMGTEKINHMFLSWLGSRDHLGRVLSTNVYDTLGLSLDEGSCTFLGKSDHVQVLTYGHVFEQVSWLG